MYKDKVKKWFILILYFSRDTAYKAGQRIVLAYADTAVTLLLPELENGLFNDNWRIRYSSVQLLGDLLYKISGVSGKMTTETANEDDNMGTEASQRAVVQVNFFGKLVRTSLNLLKLG